MTADVAIAERKARAVAILADLVAFDTVSNRSNLGFMEYVEALLARRGVRAELLRDVTGEKANLLATIGPAGADGVILSGHSDVVPVIDQHWTSDPFKLTRGGDRLYGRGTADMKAFIACVLAAVEFADHAALRRPVHLAFSYDEEVGCLGAPPLIERIRSTILPPAVAIIGEPTSMRVTASHKSIQIHSVRVTGAPAHSSAPHLGVSANHVAIGLMNVLLQTAKGLTAEDLRDPGFDPPYSTLTVGTMEGGTAANILAAEARFVFDLRTLPSHDPDAILAPLRAEVARVLKVDPRITVTLDRLATVPGLIAVPQSEAEQLVRMVSGDNMAARAVSFGAEAGQFQQAGYPTVIFGPGSMDQAHQADEFIDISEIEKCMVFLEKLFVVLSRPAMHA